MSLPDSGGHAFCVVIPAYQPDERLVALVDQLRGSSRGSDGTEGASAGPSLPVVVVDDGSEGCDQVFSQVEACGVPVIHFERNRGKGAALKEGLRWAWCKGFSLAVTADLTASTPATPFSAWRAVRRTTRGAWYWAFVTYGKCREGLALGTRSPARSLASSTTCTSRTRRLACAGFPSTIPTSCCRLLAIATSTR